MDYNARYYSARLGRFVSADTIVPEASNPQAWNRYSYTYNNPILYTDPSGHEPPINEWIEKVKRFIQDSIAQAKPLVKQAITEGIVTGAEIAHQMYIPTAGFVSQHPGAMDVANGALDSVGSEAGARTNMNPNSLGWGDLFSMWLFEIGPSEITFGPDAPTTQDLMADQGVIQARQKALA